MPRRASASSAIPVGVASSPAPPAWTRQPRASSRDRRHRDRHLAVCDRTRPEPTATAPARQRGRRPGRAARRRPRPRRRSSPARPPRGSARRRPAMPCTRRLGVGQPGEDGAAPGRGPAPAASAAAQQLPDGPPGPVRRIVDQHLDVDLGRAQPGPGHRGRGAAGPRRAAPRRPRPAPQSRSAPASTRAPSSMSPATPADASIQACRPAPVIGVAPARRSGRRDGRRRNRCRC